MKRFGLIASLLFLLTAPALADLDKNAKKWVEQVRPIILPEEEKTYKSLKNNADAAEFQKIFWARRDPNLDTPENEFQAEYLKLVAEVDPKFKAGGREGSLTDCGRIYILMGAPDEVKKQSSVEAAFRTPEVWTYKDRPGMTFSGGSLDILLDGSCMLPQGNRMADQLNRIAEFKVVQANLSYKRDAKGALVKLADLLPKPTPVQALLKEPRADFKLTAQQVMEIRSQDGASVFIAGLIHGDASGLTVTESGGRKVAHIVVSVHSTDKEGRVLKSQDREVSAPVDASNEFTSSFGMPLRPGEHAMKIGAIDPKSNKGAVAELSVKTEVYGAEMSVSPVMVLADIEEGVTAAKDDPYFEFVFGSTRFVPRYGNVFKQSEAVTLLCAVYGAAKSRTLSMLEYERLVDGISYEDAVNVIGFPGVEGAKNGATIVYSWKNADGSNASVTFEDGKLISRAQAGLPPQPGPGDGKISVAGGFQIVKDGKAVAKAPDQVYDVEPATPSAGPVPLGSYAPGKYKAIIKLRDNVAQKDYVRETEFEIIP